MKIVELVELLVCLSWLIFLLLVAYGSDKGRSDNQAQTQYDEREEENDRIERKWREEERKLSRRQEQQFKKFRREFLGESRWRVFWEDFDERNSGI